MPLRRLRKRALVPMTLWRLIRSTITGFLGGSCIEQVARCLRIRRAVLGARGLFSCSSPPDRETCTPKGTGSLWGARQATYKCWQTRLCSKSRPLPTFSVTANRQSLQSSQLLYTRCATRARAWSGVVGIQDSSSLLVARGLPSMRVCVHTHRSRGPQVLLVIFPPPQRGTYT